jgi:hypothetical protein
MAFPHLPLDLIDFTIPKIDTEKGHIYFLFDDDDKLLYIGQTIQMESRIITHLKNNVIPFSKCKYILCKRNDMNELEFQFIVINSPPYNGPPPPSQIWISTDQVKRRFPNFKGKICLLKKMIKLKKLESFHGYFRIKEISDINQELFGDLS